MTGQRDETKACEKFLYGFKCGPRCRPLAPPNRAGPAARRGSAPTASARHAIAGLATVGNRSGSCTVALGGSPPRQLLVASMSRWWWRRWRGTAAGPRNRSDRRADAADLGAGGAGDTAARSPVRPRVAQDDLITVRGHRGRPRDRRRGARRQADPAVTPAARGAAPATVRPLFLPWRPDPGAELADPLWIAVDRASLRCLPPGKFPIVQGSPIEAGRSDEQA